jgi:ATP-binding cassette, subfamily C (CFTR/MRP), member 1
MVLDKGRIVEFDAPKKLLSNTNSIFFSMAKSAGLISE